MDNAENVIILSPADFQNICRTCLSQVQLESIFTDDQTYSIVNMLMAIANVQISDTDNLPPKICTSCIKSLNLAFRFKQQCEEAEYKLKEFLNAYKIINGCDYLENVEAISTETEEQKISNYSNIDKFNTGDLAPPHITDTDVIVESFVGIIFDKEEKDENLCTETIVKCENIEKTNQTEGNLNENLKKKQIEFVECTVCKKLINAKNLKQHMKGAHSTEKCFQCKDCVKKFSFRSNFLRHLKSHAGDRKQEKKQMFKPCPTCGKLINSRRLNNHIKLHSAEKFRCEICNYKFSIRSNYVRHLKIHNGEKSYVCETCGKGFIQSYSLREHIRVHTRERPYKCKLCDRAFTQSTQLNKHQKEMHNLELPAEDNKQFTCKTCNEIFTSSLALNAHSRVHLNKPFHCNKCNKLFTNKKNLGEHNCTNQSINCVKQVGFGVFICDECGKQFSNNPSLIAHRYRYHSNESHLCNFCGKNCISSIQLKRHLIIHSEERPFKCEHCDKTFKTKLTLRVHRLQHTGERPFACTECDKTFHQAAHLRAHRRVHTGEKPYNCIICNKSFACKINYIVHSRIHSGETPYICPICNKGFHHSTAKKKHLRTHKNQNEVSVARN